MHPNLSWRIGFDSRALGAVVEYDTKDNARNATSGQRLLIHNFAYRKTFGGDQSFDVYHLDYNHYLPHDDGHVFAIDVKNRWTDDADVGAYSSVNLRGYIRGNYLNEHYSHIDVDERFALTSHWSLATH